MALDALYVILSLIFAISSIIGETCMPHRSTAVHTSTTQHTCTIQHTCIVQPIHTAQHMHYATHACCSAHTYFATHVHSATRALRNTCVRAYTHCATHCATQMRNTNALCNALYNTTALLNTSMRCFKRTSTCVRSTGHDAWTAQNMPTKPGLKGHLCVLNQNNYFS